MKFLDLMFGPDVVLFFFSIVLSMHVKFDELVIGADVSQLQGIRCCTSVCPVCSMHTCEVS